MEKIIENYKLPINQDLISKCLDFAKSSALSSKDKYAERNQFNLDKIIDDIKVGKIGEYLVFSYFKDKLINLSEPDINLYEKHEKSWSTDLKDDNGIKIAVKTQRDFIKNSFSAKAGSSSITIGKSYDCDTEIFKEQNNNYVAFVSLNIPKRFGEIKAVVKVKWLHDNKLFKDMKQDYLKGNKMAVYYEDLELHKDLFQL